MEIIGIYKIQSKIKPWEVYIGSSKNIIKRWAVHLTALKKGKHHSPKLQYHYNKYGVDDLQFIIIIECKKDELLQLEQYYLDICAPWFNVLQIAGSPKGHHWKHTGTARKKISLGKKGKPSPRKGKHHTDIAKEKNRQAHLGKKQSEKTIKKRSLALKGRVGPMKGRRQSFESNKKRSITMMGKYAGINSPLYGRKLTPEHKNKISLACQGKIVSKETRQKMSLAQIKKHL